MMYGSAPGFVANATQDVRMAFVRKVYSLFFVSILISVIAGAMSIQNQSAFQLAWEFHYPLMIVGFILVLIMSWGRRKQGLNLLLLYVFSAVEGVFVAPIFAIYEHRMPGLPLEAGTLATAVFGGLTLYVFVTRQDFNFLGGFLFTALISLIIGGFFMAFFHIAALHTFYCVAGILIFSGYVLYDTSLIMNRLNVDEAPIGALELYLDFLNLIMLIMSLLGGGRRR